MSLNQCRLVLDTEQDVVDWILGPLNAVDRRKFGEIATGNDGDHKSKHKSFDCSIMDTADDIAYGVHDLEDVIALKLISEKDFHEFVPAERCFYFFESLKEKYPDEVQDGACAYGTFVQSLFSDSRTRKRFIGRLVHHFVTNLDIEELEHFSEPLLRYKVVLRPEYTAFLDALRELIYKKVIKSLRTAVTN